MPVVFWPAGMTGRPRGFHAVPFKSSQAAANSELSASLDILSTSPGPLRVEAAKRVYRNCKAREPIRASSRH